MKLFREGIVVLGIYLVGELISGTFDLPIPGNILGMLILLVLLMTKIIKLDQIETISNFFLDHLAFFFIPAGAALMNSAGIIKDTWFKLILVCIITTVVIIACTGLIVQFVSRRMRKEEKESGYNN